MWASAILKQIGAPANSTNIGYLIGWFALEGGGGKNNPLNTKLVTSGSTGTVPGTNGVQNYQSPAAGVRATVRTMQNSFPAITASLRAGQGIPVNSQTEYELHGWSAGYRAPWSNGYKTITPSNGYSPTINITPYGGYRPSIAASKDQQASADPGLNNALNSAFGSFASEVSSAAGWVISGGGIGTLISDTVMAIGLIPSLILRSTEFVSGALILGAGLYIGMTPQQQGTSVLRKGVNNLVKATPLGEYARIRKAMQLGSREGRQEHYRLKARKSSRKQLSSEDAREAMTGSRKPISKTRSKQLQKEGEKKYVGLAAKRKDK